MRSLPRDSSVTLHRLDRPLARAHGSIVSQLLPALFDLYPRGFTGHVAHPGRSIRRGEDQRPQGGDKATALALAERAIAALQKLLSIPYSGPLASNVPLTPALVRLDPMFDPLRNDPRSEKLAASPAPKPQASR